MFSRFLDSFFTLSHKDLMERSLIKTLEILAAFTAVLLIWTLTSPLEELSRTDRATVVPSKQTQVIQSLEGGLIKQIFVREGQKVQAQEVLAEIDDLWAQSQLEKNLLHIEALSQRAQRLEAEMHNTPYSFEGLEKAVASFDNEYRIYESRQKELFSKIATLDHEIAQLDHQIQQESSEHHYAQKSYDLKEQEYQMVLSLVDHGAVSPQELLNAQRALGDLQGLVEQTFHRIERSWEYRQVLLSRKEEVYAQWNRDMASEYARVKLELQQLYEEQKTLQDKERRTQLRAPISGVINKTYIHTPGAVLRPGETLFDLVPADDILIVEAKVHPKDIGFIHQGMKARVKISAFDFSLYGGLDGIVEHISPDVLMERDMPYYLVRISTTKSTLERQGKSYQIMPGMMASVDILTGHKSVWHYLMKPILKSRQIAMTER